MKDIITTLQKLHYRIENKIVGRLDEFKKNNTKQKIEKEFFFCLLTPQCRAKVCWDNIEALSSSGLLYSGSEQDISNNFRGIRFRNNKAHYIVEAREKFFNGSGSFLRLISEEKDSFFLRQYIVKNIKGMGYKEASHFLRNIGKGDELSILDRHILRGLKKTSVIEEIPESLSEKKYLEIEKAMKKFAIEKVKVPVAHLDFLFWYLFNGEIFK